MVGGRGGRRCQQGVGDRRLSRTDDLRRGPSEGAGHIVRASDRGPPAPANSSPPGFAPRLRFPTDPLIYRFYELVSVYGTTFKELIAEEFGDGIMSAIDFEMEITRREDPAGDRVQYRHEREVPCLISGTDRERDPDPVAVAHPVSGADLVAKRVPWPRPGGRGTKVPIGRDRKGHCQAGTVEKGRSPVRGTRNASGLAAGIGPPEKRIPPSHLVAVPLLGTRRGRCTIANRPKGVGTDSFPSASGLPSWPLSCFRSC